MGGNSGTPTHVSIIDGHWADPATWAGGNAPNQYLGGKHVVINHRVEFGGDDLYIENGALTVNRILYISNKNVKMEHPGGVINIHRGLIHLVNSNFENKNATVNFIGGAMHLCDGNYKDESGGAPRGTYGTGYIYAINGGIENVGSAPFSSGIAWSIDGGSAVNLPTPEDHSVGPGACDDEHHYLGRLDPTVRYTYHFTNVSASPVEVAFADALPAGLAWDTAFSQATGGISTAGLTFSNGGADVAIASLMIPPGDSTLTLETLSTPLTGTVVNDSTITPADPIHAPITAEASVDLD